MAAVYEQPKDVVKRVRFFDGQYLQDQDFVDEQHYQIDRQRRHNRTLHVAGIADGLGVTAVVGAPQVVVAAGTAVDADGRLLVVPDEPAETRTLNLASYLSRTVNLYLVFQEVESDPQASGGADFGRWLEQPQLVVVDVQTTYNFALPPVLLARVVLNSQAVETVDGSVRIYSGLRLPGPAADAPILRTAASGLVGLAGSLTVDGNMGIGAAAPAQKLMIVGPQNAGKDPDSGMSYAGQVAIKGNAPQIDFIDTDNNDWSIHVNSNKLYFIRQPWEHSDLVLDGNGNVGIGTVGPSAKLHVNGDALVSGALSFGEAVRQMINLWSTGYGIGVQSYTQYFRTDRHFAWFQGGSHHNGELNPGDGGSALMVLRGGQLGIGTANPENAEGWNKVVDLLGGDHAKLSVRTGNIESRWMVHDTGFWGAPAGLISGTKSNHPFSLATNATPRLTITANGHIGIGTVEPENADRWNQVLDVLGSPHAKFSVRTDNVESRWMVHDAGFWGAPAGLILGTRTNHPFTLITRAKPRLTIASNGKVGIGNDAPDADLHVSGDFLVSNDATVSGNLSFGSNVRQMINLWNTEYGIGVQDGTHYFRTSGHFAWYLGGSHRNGELQPGNDGTALMVLRSGHLGIGTANPENAEGWNKVIDLLGAGHAKLSVRTANIESRLMAHDTGFWGAPAGMVLGTKTDHPLSLVTGAKQSVTIASNGSVGIGTNNPAQKLTIVGSYNASRDPDSGMQSGGQLAIKGNAPQIDFIDTDHNDWSIHVNSHKLYFIRQPWNYTDLVLDGGGNVGIGTDSPSTKLEVNGYVRISGGNGLQLFKGDGSQYWSIYPEWWDSPDPDLFFNFSGNTSGWASGWLEPLGSGWRNNSDERLKEDIAPLQNVLSRVLQISPSSYRFINASQESARRYVGFIAQQVEKVFPDLVTEKRGYKRS
ncbi:MAG: tail fiber domain-containing protein [Caldilineaceae bacterium]